MVDLWPARRLITAQLRELLPLGWVIPAVLGGQIAHAGAPDTTVDFRVFPGGKEFPPQGVVIGGHLYDPHPLSRAIYRERVKRPEPDLLIFQVPERGEYTLAPADEPSAVEVLPGALLAPERAVEFIVAQVRAQYERDRRPFIPARVRRVQLEQERELQAENARRQTQARMEAENALRAQLQAGKVVRRGHRTG